MVVSVTLAAFEPNFTIRPAISPDGANVCFVYQEIYGWYRSKVELPKGLLPRRRLNIAPSGHQMEKALLSIQTVKASIIST